ncbi:uncharacterized protein LOC134789087 [Penaeus indicus]|uniref:uncharacterized protein LOC134789087 n=1 Tax=Penaeus indicus TaxID=29960 RepID=UPI00300D5E85
MQKTLPHLPQALNDRCSCAPYLQVPITLRYMATGIHQLTVPDCHSVPQSHISRCSSRVTRVVARMSRDTIKMPGANETLRQPPVCRNGGWNPSRSTSNPQSHQEQRCNSSHTATRNCIERAFGVLKRFCCLGKKTQTSLENTKVTLAAAAKLHNLAVRQRKPLPDDAPFQPEAGAPDDPNPLPDNHAGAP